MQKIVRGLLLLAAAAFAQMPAKADPLPGEIAKTLTRSGLPLKSFGFYVRLVDAEETGALAALNEEEPFLMASTAKIVTSLAALDMLGPAHRLQSSAFATGPVHQGRLQGDLVISGGKVPLTAGELAGWFKQMRAEGLREVAGDIVLEQVVLSPDAAPPMLVQPAPVPAPAASPASPQDGIVVALAPGEGGKARISLRPRPSNVQVINDVASVPGGCDVFVVWDAAGNAGAPQLRVHGRWDESCGRRDVASVRPPPSVRFAPVQDDAPDGVAAVPPARLVADLWASTGGRLGGRVIATDQWEPPRGARLLRLWASRLTTALPSLIHKMNKTSNNGTAHSLLLSLSPRETRRGGDLQHAQRRVHEWLREQGLHDGDIHIDHGSGLSRTERGKPRALAQLLCKAWRANGSRVFVNSLPIAGVDGTLAHRMVKGAAKGQAYLKTGTLRDARALAGYVRARSGKVYAVAAMVNHPQAARATPALDAVIEWVARNG